MQFLFKTKKNKQKKYAVAFIPEWFLLTQLDSGQFVLLCFYTDFLGQNISTRITKHIPAIYKYINVLEFDTFIVLERMLSGLSADGWMDG